MAPPMPNFGGGPLPGLGTMPASTAGWEAPGGLPFSGGDADDPALQDLAGEELPDAQEEDPSAHDASDNPDEDNDPQDVSSDEPAAGPTPVTLPDGETVTAASPQLAAAIQAAVGGTPIAEAFQQQGMTIPHRERRSPTQSMPYGWARATSVCSRTVTRLPWALTRRFSMAKFSTSPP